MLSTNAGHRVLVTCDAESDGLAFEELRRIGHVEFPGIWLDTGDAVQGSILLVRTELDFVRFSQKVTSFGSVFIRHLCPVDYEVELKGDESDLETILALGHDLAPRLDSERTFSVQSRVLGEGKLPYRKVVLNESMSLQLEGSSGARMDCRHPHHVVSIISTPARAYVGLSLAAENRSDWPGGRHRFKREEDQVSRAEFKLLEAMSVFGFTFPNRGLALDIGASPGGWSRVLAEQGLKVDAVDPGYLDPKLKSNRAINYFRRRIQEYSPGTKRFSAIVNDMKMDARDSIEIMLGFAERLTPDGVAVMTLKMPKAGPTAADSKRVLEMLHENLDRLAEGFSILGARQLYHNRSEVTVVMRRVS
ncbi:MAG: SAM-dependent methyltransferase [Fimbriimonas sp.]|nr:SAM-dependent methyltransferase [Fimbriimonas sp.]